MSLSEREKGMSESELQDVEKVARAQQKLEHEYTRWQAIKLYPRAAVYIAIIVWAMITVGYENQASGIVLSIPTFRKDFGHEYDGLYVLDGKWQLAISGGPYAAFVFGCFFASYITEYTGRKYLIWAASAATIAFIGVEFAATTIEVFFVGKFLNAVCLGMIQTVGTAYIAELTPLALRAMATTCVNLAFCIGPFVCTLVTYRLSTREDRWAYRAIFVTQWFFAVVTLFIMYFLPESPYHRVIKGQNEKALASLRMIYKEPGVAESQLQIIRANIEEAKVLASQGSYVELFNKNNLKRTLIAIFPFVMQPMSGLAYVASYQTYYYQLLGFDTLESFQISCGAQALSVSGTIVSLFIVDRFGRRFVTLYGMISLSILNILTAALGLRRTEHSYVTASAAFMTMYNFFYNSGIGPIAYVINSEIPTSKLRAKSIGLGLASNNALLCMWSFVLPYMFNPDQADMGSSINFIFAGCSFASVLIFFFYLPETAGRSFEEVDELFKAGVPARKWKSYTTREEIESDQVFREQVKTEIEHAEN